MSRAEAGNPRGLLQQADATKFPVHHRRYLPCADVAAFVEHFWMVRWDLRGLPARTVETLPHPSVHLVVDANGPSRVGGVHSGRFVRVLEGQGRVFGIKFRPGGFYPLWTAPLSDLVDRSLTLAEAFGDAGPALEAAVLALDDDEERMAVAECFLRERLPPPDENVALIDRLVSLVVADRELCRVDDLAALSGLSKRGLQRLFNQYVGISPKWMIQRYRLHEALDQLAGHETLNWAQFALDLGYFDQAHFIRDFRMMVGRTPAQYAAQRPAELGPSSATFGRTRRSSSPP